MHNSQQSWSRPGARCLHGEEQARDACQAILVDDAGLSSLAEMWGLCGAHMSVRSGSPCTKTSRPMRSCSSLEYLM